MTDAERDPFDGIEDLNQANPPAEPGPVLDPAPVEPAPITRASTPPAPPAPVKRAAPTMLARIKPFNPKRGNKVRTYTVYGIKFLEEKGWYRVNAKVAAYLEKVTRDGDPEGVEIFDVCTEEEAIALEAKDRKKAMERASVSEPNNALTPRDTEDARTTLTTRDLPGRGGQSRSMT